MPKNIFQHARIIGISTVVPKQEIRLEDELQYFDGNPKKAARTTKMVGIDRRRIADPGVVTSDLCQQAAENLLRGMEVDRASIDAIILVTQTPDYILPATACILQDKLGLSKNCAAFDVNQGCTAYTYGLWLASSLLEARAASKVLVLCGEGSAKLNDPNNRIIAPVFGDSGTATLLEYCADENPAWFLLGTDGSGYESLIWPFGQARIPAPATAAEYAPICEVVADQQGTPWRLSRSYMDGGAIFDFTLNVVPDHILELLDFSGYSRDEIDMLVLHQANKQIVQSIADKTGFPREKAPYETFSKYGNLAGASIPAVICDVLGDLVQTSAVRILLSGFGVGLSWASAVLSLDRIWCSGIRDYETPDNLPTPAELVEYWRQKLASS